MSAEAFVGLNLITDAALSRASAADHQRRTGVTGRVYITRQHSICMGHRVRGHESKCARLHGHNYRFHITCAAPELDSIGRVIDFSVVKEKLCMWLEDNWDHKFLAYTEDEVMKALSTGIGLHGFRSVQDREAEHTWDQSIVWVPFNPTAENIARHIVTRVGPQVFDGTAVTVVSVTVDETDKCSATYTLEGHQQ